MDPTDLQNEIAAGTIVNERGREAELGLELKQLEKALQELKEKHSALANPSETQSQSISDLQARTKILRDELGSAQRQHDMVIKGSLEKLAERRRSSVASSTGEVGHS